MPAPRFFRDLFAPPNSLHLSAHTCDVLPLKKKKKKNCGRCHPRNIFWIRHCWAASWYGEFGVTSSSSEGAGNLSSRRRLAEEVPPTAVNPVHDSKSIGEYIPGVTMTSALSKTSSLRQLSASRQNFTR